MSSSPIDRPWPAPGAPCPDGSHPQVTQDPAPVPDVDNAPKKVIPTGSFPLSASAEILSARSPWYANGQPLRSGADLSGAQGRLGAISKALKNPATPRALRADAELEAEVLRSAIEKYNHKR